ncbi:MAG: glutamate 5-kinase [Candidatus Hadarchaeales archaeon]
MIGRREDLKKAKRIVVKIGTKCITDEKSRLDERKLKKFVGDVLSIRNRRDIVIVTSGAIGAGVGRMGLSKRPESLPALQAAAAVGQGLLIQAYQKHFDAAGQPIAQILLSAEDFVDEKRYRNFKNTISTLWRWKVIPVINENDTVAVEEIKVGDNDILSAYVARGVKADLLILLSDVDGLYKRDPKLGKCEMLRLVKMVTPELERATLRSSRRFGGMFTKVQAAAMAAEAGIATVIANSARPDILAKILNGEEEGTLFLPRRS